MIRHHGVRSGAAVCARYQDALIDFVDHGEAGQEVEAALRHLERCRECERDLAATALVLTALRRMVAEARAQEASPDAWLRLRARVEPKPRGWIPGTVTGLVMGAALVTVLLLPSAGRLGTSSYVGPGDSAATSDQSAAVLGGPPSGVLTLPAGPGHPNPRIPKVNRPEVEQIPAPAADTAGGTGSARYPDNIRPEPAAASSEMALGPLPAIRRT